MVPNKKIAQIIDLLIEKVIKNDFIISIKVNELLAESYTLEEIEAVFKSFFNMNYIRIEDQERLDTIFPIEEHGSITFFPNDIDFIELSRYRNRMAEVKPIIKPRVLELIAQDIGNSDSANALISLLKGAGVPECFINYPNTKWKMLNDVFNVLSFSLNQEHHKILFKIFEEACHPLRFDGDKAQAIEKQDYYSSLLEYDDYCFNKNKIVKGALKHLEKIKERSNKRKNVAMQEAARFFNNLSSAGKPAKTYQKDQGVKIIINNSNVQNNTAPKSIREVHKSKQNSKGFEFTEGKTLRYKGQDFADLSPLQVHLCEKIFEKERNFNLKTVEVENHVYGGDIDSKRQEKFKKLVDRFNDVVKVEFGVKKLIKYGTEHLRRQY